MNEKNKNPRKGVPRNKREFIKTLPIAKEWNDEKSIDDYTAASEYEAQWKCLEYGHIYTLAVNLRVRRKKPACPYCNNRKVLEGFNDLATIHPYLLSEWNDEKEPTEVLANTNDKIQWKCLAHGHKWKISPYSRIKFNSNCPYCGNQKLLQGFNDFATVYPEIAKEWHPTRNDTKPDTFIMNYGIQYWWICTKNHEYKATCRHRAERNQGCPICSGRQILAGFNDLASQRSELMKDWDYSQNALDPTKISVHRNEKAQWKCYICSHKWEALISNRSRGFGCPKCSGAISKQEKTLLKFIRTMLPGKVLVVENDKKIINPKEIDIFIPSLNIGFEYNGLYWHDKESYLNDLKNNTQFSNERVKEILCAEKNVKLFHVWSDEWLLNEDETRKKIKIIIKNSLNNLPDSTVKTVS